MPVTTDVLKHPRAQEALPTPVLDGAYPEERGNRYGEALMIPNLTFRKKSCEEGSYFVFCNATPLTGVAGGVVTAYVATTPLLVIKNTHSTRKLYLDRIRLIWTVAPASATSAHIVGEVDTDRGTLPTGGTAQTPVNAHLGNSEPASASVFFGALTAQAASGAKIRVGRAVIRSVIAVVQDETVIVFGGDDSEGPLSDYAGTTAKRVVVNQPPVVLDPGQCYYLHLFCPANAATPPSFEVEGAFQLR